MVRSELRIVTAVLATFAALFGLAVSLHGLFFDENDVVWSGVAVIAASVLACALTLNLHPRDVDHPQHRES